MSERRRIRLIATDLDGTLVGEGSPFLYEGYYDAVRALHSMGIFFAVFTGRHIDSARKLFSPVRDMVYYVCDNGAITGTGDRIMDHTAIPGELYRELLAEYPSMKDTQLLVTTPEGACYPADADPAFVSLLRDSYRFEVEPSGDLQKMERVIKYSLYNTKDVAAATRLCREHFRDRLYGVVAGTCWVDFMMPGVGKGKALKRLLKELELDAGSCIAFGDQMNDLEMIQTAGIGMAVEEAAAPCLEAADRIIPGWEKAGVLQVLNRIIENGGEL